MANMENNDKPKFEVLPAGELRRKYGLYAENRPTIRLDRTRVPGEFHWLIPLAEEFGIGDDLIRDDYVDKCSTTSLRELVNGIDRAGDHLWDWLAGPEAESTNPSDEYVAFTCMTMAYDQAKLRLKERETG
jgi:hypothetical protein